MISYVNVHAILEGRRNRAKASSSEVLVLFFPSYDPFFESGHVHRSSGEKENAYELLNFNGMSGECRIWTGLTYLQRLSSISKRSCEA